MHINNIQHASGMESRYPRHLHLQLDTLKTQNQIMSSFGILRLLYRPRNFHRAQIYEDWSLGTRDKWR
jgi:hypothetical protein